MGGSYVPRRKSERRSADARGRPVQSFIDSEMSERFDEYLMRHDLTVKECLRWLVSYAIEHDLEPPRQR